MYSPVTHYVHSAVNSFRFVFYFFMTCSRYKRICLSTSAFNSNSLVSFFISTRTFSFARSHPPRLRALAPKVPHLSPTMYSPVTHYVLICHSLCKVPPFAKPWLPLLGNSTANKWRCSTSLVLQRVASRAPAMPTRRLDLGKWRILRNCRSTLLRHPSVSRNY